MTIGHLLLEISLKDQAAGLLGDIVAAIAADSPELIFIRAGLKVQVIATSRTELHCCGWLFSAQAFFSPSNFAGDCAAA